MPAISTATRKRIARSRRKQQREIAVRNPARNNAPFRFDVSLRIAGIGEQHNGISTDTGLLASHMHKAGDQRNSSRVWLEDIWILSSPLAENVCLEEHLNWMWDAVAPHKSYFERLVSKAIWADICLGCLSESVYPMWSVSASSLTIARELKLGLSFNFTVT